MFYFVSVFRALRNETGFYHGVLLLVLLSSAEKKLQVISVYFYTEFEHFHPVTQAPSAIMRDFQY